MIRTQKRPIRKLIIHILICQDINLKKIDFLLF